MNEPTEPTTSRLSLERIGWVLLWLAVGVALVGGWLYVAVLWNDLRGEGSVVYDVALITIAVIMLALTATVIASIRFRRLRAALLPVELGLVVGGVIVGMDARASEVDTFDDVIGIAIMFGIGTAIILSFASILLEGTRRRGRWMSGIAAALLVLGLLAPTLLERLENSAAYIDAAAAAEMPMFELMNRFSDDDQLMLGGVHVSSTSPSGSVLSAGATSPVYMGGGLAVGGKAGVFVDADDIISVRITPAVAGVEDVAVEMRTGTCQVDGETVLERWVAQEGRRSILTVAGETIRDVQPTDRLSLRWGSGTSLGSVTCIDIGSPISIMLAREGAADFARDCLAPLDLTVEERVGMRPESFQDEGCARRMRSLADLAGGTVYRTKARANEVADCVRDTGAGAKVTRLRSSAGWVLALDLSQQPNGDPWMCLSLNGEVPIDGVGLGYASPAIGMSGTVDPYAGSAVAIDPATGLPYGPYAATDPSMDPAAVAAVAAEVTDDPDGDGDPSAADLAKLR